MMPVVRLNDATFADLKTLATWLSTETPSQTIDVIVAQTMRKLDLERDVDEATDDGEADDVLEFRTTPGLAFTRVLNATVDGQGLPKANWASLLLSVIAAVKSQGLAVDELVKILDIPASRSKLSTQGYTFHQHLGISIQGQSAQDAWKECERLAAKFQVPVEVQFQWRDNPKAQHPGRQGILRAGHSAD
jgi:hypothetical protein